MRKLLLVLIFCPLLACCNDNDDCDNIENKEIRLVCEERRRGPTEPTPVVPVPKFYTVEYRVIGTARLAEIVYTSSIHGSTELTTGLPWFANFRSDRDRIFVSLYARAQNTGTVRIQILVDGELFREASTDGFFGSSVEVSGTLFNPQLVTVSKQR